jgi:hypothetical protein
VITVDDIIRLEEWVARAKSDEERKKRLGEMQALVFPDGLSAEEIAERKQVIERAKKAMRQRELDAQLDPMPTLSIPLVPVQLPSQWEGLISKKSKAYHRGSRHDGTLEEVKQLRQESRGSPFDVDSSPQKEK